METEFDKVQDKVTKLLGTWSSSVQDDVKKARKLRDVDIDEEEQRVAGRLQEDERYIPVRIIDTNIRREQASYVTYLVSSRRQVIFECIEDSSVVVDGLEKDFTKRCRFSGWQLPFFSGIDSAQMNGWCNFEVVYDNSKPGKFAIEYIGKEDLAFSDDTEDMQAQELLVRIYRLTKEQLNGLKDFNKAEVKRITEDKADQKKTLFEVHKIYFRVEGVVFDAWTAKDCETWLREPKPLFLGIYKLSPPKMIMNPQTQTPEEQPQEPMAIYEENYPLFRFQYLISENPQAVKCMGRFHLDKPAQEAASSLLSSYITNTRRSSNVYASVDDIGGGMNSTRDPAQTTVKLFPGAIFDKKLNFWQLPQPSPQMLAAVQALMVQNQSETSQVNYAVQNRKDTEKTATEIRAALATSSQLTSVQVVLFSTVLRDIYTLCWKIYKSQVVTGAVETSIPINLFTDYTYNLKPSGDQDVIERQEKLARMSNFWNVLASSPLGQTQMAKVFMEKFIRLSFPDEAEEYISDIRLVDQEKNIITKLREMLMALIIDPETGQPLPQYQQYLPQLMQLNAQIDMVLYGQSRQGSAAKLATPPSNPVQAPGIAGGKASAI